jgi:hypothetical protein
VLNSRRFHAVPKHEVKYHWLVHSQHVMDRAHIATTVAAQRFYQ